MIIYILILSVIFPIEKNQALYDISYEMEYQKLSAVVEVSCTLTSRRKITQSALVVINTEQLVYNKACLENITVVTYSVGHVYEIISRHLCDDVNTVDYHPSAMLIIFEHKVHLMDILKNHYRWINYKVGTLLILFSFQLNVDVSTDSLQSVFEITWSNKIISVVILSWSNKQKSLTWYTYNSFTNTIYNVTGAFDLYNNKTTNMHKYVFKSCLLHDMPRTVIFDYNNGTYVPGGPEGKAFYMMANLLNISTKIVEPLHKAIFPASVHYAKNNMCDVLFSTTVRPGYLEGMANIYPLFLDHWCVILPKSKPITGFMNFIMPFQISVWCYLICTLIIMFSGVQLLYICHTSWNVEEDLQFSVLEAFGLLLNMGNDIKMQCLTFRTRMFIFSIAVFGFFTSYAYQSLLFGYLVKPRYGQEYHTLAGVADSGIKVLIEEESMKIWLSVQKDLNRYYEKFNNILIGTKYDHYVDRLNSYDINHGYVLSQSYAKFVMQSYKGNSLFYQTQECLVPYRRSYAVACNFPLSEKIEKIMLRLLETGFYEHWLSYVGIDKVSLNETKNALDAEESIEISLAKALSLENLKGLIIIWGCALGFCIVVFLGEIIWWKIQNNNFWYNRIEVVN